MVACEQLDDAEMKLCPHCGLQGGHDRMCQMDEDNMQVRINRLIASAEQYMLAVKRLGEESGYNRLTYFEAPILKMPTEEMREEAHERWLELNISGQQLSAAVTAAKGMLNEPQPSAESAPPKTLLEAIHRLENLLPKLRIDHAHREAEILHNVIHDISHFLSLEPPQGVSVGLLNTERATADRLRDENDRLRAELAQANDQLKRITTEPQTVRETDAYRDTVKKIAAVREKRLAELVEENAQLRADLAKKRPETLPGMIAEVYGELDAEDCAMIDREWARMRGYILPTNGTSTLSLRQRN